MSVVVRPSSHGNNKVLVVTTRTDTRDVMCMHGRCGRPLAAPTPSTVPLPSPGSIAFSSVSELGAVMRSITSHRAYFEFVLTVAILHLIEIEIDDVSDRRGPGILSIHFHFKRFPRYCTPPLSFLFHHFVHFLFGCDAPPLGLH
jgi:hypothetical protein